MTIRWREYISLENMDFTKSQFTNVLAEFQVKR
jgi:hypothetical protein